MDKFVVFVNDFNDLTWANHLENLQHVFMRFLEKTLKSTLKNVNLSLGFYQSFGSRIVSREGTHPNTINI
jgi:hypothetical protein